MRIPRWLVRAWNALREFEWSWSLLGYLGFGGKVTAMIGAIGTAIIASLQGANAASVIVTGMVTAAALVIVVGAARAPSLKIGKTKRLQSAPLLHPQGPRPQAVEEFHGRVFTKEQVRLDNRRYINCEFRDCSFLYEGLGPPYVINPKIEGTTSFNALSDPVRCTMLILKMLRMMADDTGISEIGIPTEVMRRRLGEPED